MKPEQKVGPDEERFGAWARTLPRDGEAKFALDPAFARSVEGKSVVIGVIYLDRGNGMFTVRAAGRKFEQPLGRSGRWRRAAFKIDRVSFASDGNSAHVTIVAAADLTLHMIEIARN